MDVDEESTKTTITTGHNQVIHVRQDSASELEALFNTVMNPNFKSKSLPMKARNLPKSFFEQPDKPRHQAVYHGHSQSMGGLSVSTAPQIIHSRSSSSDSNASHTSTAQNTNNNNGAPLGSPAISGAMKGNHKVGYMSPAQRRMPHSPYTSQQSHVGLSVPQVSHARSKSSPASLELMNVAHLQVKASDIPPDMPLPPGWSAATTTDGQQYFMNHNDRTTTWEDPRIAIIKQQRQSQLVQQSQSLSVTSSPLPQTSIHNNIPADRALQQSLPPGWEQSKTQQGEVFFINHQTKSTSWIDPRLQNIQGNGQQNNSQLQQQLMKVNQMDMASNAGRSVGSSLPPQQQSMLKHFTQEKDLLMRKQMLKQSQSQMSASGMDPFLGSGSPNYHQRDPSQDSGVGMGSNYSLPRTPDDYLGNVEEMDTGDIARRIHNPQIPAPTMVPTSNHQQPQQQPTHQQHNQMTNNNQRFPDFLDTLPSSNVDFSANPQTSAVGNPSLAPPCGNSNNPAAPLDGSDLVPSIPEAMSQDFDVESMLNHVKPEPIESGMIWL
uniref:Yorkie homolog n=1 Tax=Phallusia mammillata TaxID=59560 RepID=A0A6F9DXX2_9ASCI|nr:yorkie homolog [Phallusia mammillata]